MVWPTTPRDVVTELYLGDTWVDVSADVRVADGITIARGAPNESSRPQHSRCELRLDNPDGDYSPDWPTSPHYGDLDRNTPIRVAIRTITDAFARTVSSGWGSTDTGQAWTNTGAGGSVLASDFAVGSGVGTHSVPTTSAYRISYLATTSYRDVEVVADVSLSFTNVTGGDLEPANVVLRGQSTTDYYMVRLVITSAEAVTIALLHFDGTVIASAVTVAGLTHSSSQTLRVRAQVEGQTLRAKVWAAAGAEPYGWQVSGHSELINEAGWVGIRNGVAAANSNAKPIVFSIDNLAVRIPRFSGEVAEWPAEWDLSGNDVSVRLEAAGIMRRLGQGASPLQSALRRGLLSGAITTPVGYWPCEDTGGSGFLSSAIPNVIGMVVSGTPDYGASSAFAASDPLPALNLSAWKGYLPAYTVISRQQVRMLLSVPSGGVPADAVLCAVGTSGTTIGSLELTVTPGGALQLKAYAPTGGLAHDSGVIGYAVNGVPLMLSIECEQVGADVFLNLVTVEPGATSGLQLPGPGDTIVGKTIGIVRTVEINPNGTLDDVSVGHVSVHREWSSLFTLGDQFAAWVGEKAGDRIARLCDEEDIALSHVGDLADTMAMGPQASGKLLDLLLDAAAADLGTLYEPAGELGLAFRTRASEYNQDAVLDLDYAGGEIAPPFRGTRDDRSTRNDVTVSRPGGSSARAELAIGRMSVLPPDQGGVGRYDTSETVNVASDAILPDIASWLVHVGTVIGTRYPSIAVNLGNSAVVAAALESAVLGLGVGDRFTVSNPKPEQTADQISQLARGLSERINLYQHDIAFVSTPESPYRVMELDDADDSRLDSDATNLNEALDTTETGVDIVVSDGTLWTTSSGDRPFDIVIGGEVMTVTGVSTTGGTTQTFTVTRSVNGVVKSHSSGAEVHVAHPVVLAL